MTDSDLSQSKEDTKPQKALKEHFSIYLDAPVLPLSARPTGLKRGIWGVCTSGFMEIQVYAGRYTIGVNDTFLLLPGFLVAQVSCSAAFTVSYCSFSVDLFYHVICDCIIRSLFPFYRYMRTHFQNPLPESSVSGWMFSYRHLCDRIASGIDVFSEEYVVNLLKIPLIRVYSRFYEETQPDKPAVSLHKESMGYQFLILLMEHCREKKNVAFYAEALHVTPKYLTEVLLQVSGKSPKEWIVHYTLEEINALLKFPRITPLELAKETGFEDERFLKRFLLRHTGMSLSKYKKALGDLS